jgi:hypothetical protein
MRKSWLEGEYGGKSFMRVGTKLVMTSLWVKYEHREPFRCLL